MMVWGRALARDDVCGSLGLIPVGYRTAWFEAQNERAECEVLAAAFNIMYALSGV